ncbi:MAG: hypothetical protein K0S09_2195 [Sphingobacteriaceae bacterium]|nr:hypothetical protein [Sphingobacteriaceae bacterium]
MVLGMVLPDLVKNADKHWTFHPEKHPEKFEGDPELWAILGGWRRHLAVDRYFHSSEFFLEHTQKIRTAVAPILETSPVRPSFLAHISLELILDSLLILENIIDPSNFYQQLSEANRSSIKQFLELNSIDDSSRFFGFYDEFIESAYLHTYRESHNIMYALNRICMRVWDNPLNETQKLQLTAVLLEYQQELGSNFMSIFDEIDTLLN